MKILAASALALGLGLFSLSAAQAMPLAPVMPAVEQGAPSRGDHSCCAGMRPRFPSWALWRLPPDVHLSSRLAHRPVWPALLPQLVNDETPGESTSLRAFRC